MRPTTVSCYTARESRLDLRFKQQHFFCDQNIDRQYNVREQEDTICAEVDRSHILLCRPSRARKLKDVVVWQCGNYSRAN